MTTLSTVRGSAGSSGAAEPAAAVLAGARAMVEPALRAAIGALPQSTARPSGYHFGWWDPAGQPAAQSGGKALRPALALSAAAAVGGDRAAAVPAAVAVELVHNFSLLHDDVMDGDATRRHRPTVWAVFGVDTAILAGDALLAAAIDVLAASGAPATGPAIRGLCAAVQALVDGQAADLRFEQTTTVRLTDVLEMAANKTGALLGASCSLGALLGGAPAARAALLGEFGERVGLAFQIVDDLLGIWGDPVVTGKPVFSDLRNRKKSLPVLAALTSGTPAGRELVRFYDRDTAFTDAELPRIAELVADAGGRAWCHAHRDALLHQASTSLAAADPLPAAAAELTALAHLATHRSY
ncbi:MULTISPECIES: family 2 encapsulin nanocompartment cargo protein polyprenyl transferase [Catenuloplanes]|uniref:Geranylgeranyl diphosphate synthase type I n=1 Tax=Catenuloplanes niger TaxID=587534 RepID=A0AAE3ZUV5_9ACTN|nr:family 2 encapsulin nanocompartment cargo protein polyprenyl transferase [Catenuloplanes niger]MDR7326509.1 geranylgeranyl diphosphate synthase type I [Catenuloplanes niger]